MGLKPLSRTALSLANTRCTLQSPLPSFLSRSIFTDRSDRPPSRPSPPFSSPSSYPSQNPPRRSAPRDLNSTDTTLSDSSRQGLMRTMYNDWNKPKGRSALEITEAELDRRNLATAIAKQNTRRWKAGDVYAPHDLSGIEMRKWRTPRPVMMDAFKALDLDPRQEYKNYSIMWEYVSTMGRIKHPRETGLGNVNQRRVAKAIRRSIGMGLMPSVHNHPEVLEAEAIKQYMSARSR